MYVHVHPLVKKSGGVGEKAVHELSNRRILIIALLSYSYLAHLGLFFFPSHPSAFIVSPILSPYK